MEKPLSEEELSHLKIAAEDQGQMPPVNDKMKTEPIVLQDQFMNPDDNQFIYYTPYIPLQVSPLFVRPEGALPVYDEDPNPC